MRFKFFWYVCLLACVASVVAGSARAEDRELPVATSWFGNSFSLHPYTEFMQRKWVPHGLDAIAVTDDGRIYGNAGADEAHGAWPVFKNGNVRPAKNVWHGGLAVALGRGCIYYSGSGSYGTEEEGHGIEQYELLSDGSLGERRHGVLVNRQPPAGGAPDGKLMGMAVDIESDRLYVSDTTHNRVKIYRARDLSPINPEGFEVERPGDITVGANGNLWIVTKKHFARAFDLQHERVIGSDEARAPEVLAAVGRRPHGQSREVEPGYESAEPGGWLGIDLGAGNAEVATIARFNTRQYRQAIGGTFEGSDNGSEWTTLGTITRRPATGGGQWNQYHLDNTEPYRFYRYRAAEDKRAALRGLQFWGRSAEQPGKVAKYNPEGRRLAPVIDQIDHPAGICMDGHGRLLVADGGEGSQIHAFTGLEDNPQRDRTWRNDGRFGVKGGLLAGTGAEVGRIGPRRFHGINGIGVDEKGNLYVSQFGGSLNALEAYNASGEQLWRVHSTGFMNAGADPNDETAVYEDTRFYRMHYDRRPGEEAELHAYTIDPYTYPEDMRINGGMGLMYTYALRRIHGRLFQFQTPQHGSHIAVWKHNGADHIARPSVLISGHKGGSSWAPGKSIGYPPHQPQGHPRWIWRDKNGNGRFDADEYDQDSDEHFRSSREIDAHWVDSDGNIWLRGSHGPYKEERIWKLAVADELDAHGNPVWSWTSPDNKSWPIPEEFKENYNQISFLRPLDDGRKLLAAGLTKDFVEEGNRNRPNCAGVLVKYRIQGDDLHKRDELRLPWDNEDTVWTERTKVIVPKGDYLFVGQQAYMRSHVYELDTLEKIGHFNLGPVTSRPIFDGEWELTVTDRKSANEYLVFIGNYHASAQLMLRWKPSVEHRLFPPELLEAEPNPDAPRNSVLLEWGNPELGRNWRPGERLGDYRTGRGNKPDHYVIDIQHLTPKGWSQWRRLPDCVDGGAFSRVVTGLQPDQQYAFQLRAVNDKGASDFSNIAYVELGKEKPQPQLWRSGSTNIMLAEGPAAECDIVRLSRIGIFMRDTKGIPVSFYLDNFRVYGTDKNGQELVLFEFDGEDGTSPFADNGSFALAPTDTAPEPGWLVGDLGERVYATTATAESERLHEMRHLSPDAAEFRIPADLDRTKPIRVGCDAAIDTHLPDSHVHIELFADFYKDGEKVGGVKRRLRKW